MFELIRTTAMPEYDGQALFYEHKETGMQVFHIKNSQKERCCIFMFGTPSEDDTGVAHIIEHTVLCGSKRFPVKDLVTLISRTSPNTFLNGLTFTDKTMYPFASPLKKDFDNIFDIYADAVFDPLLRKESFLQEAYRAFDGKYEGIVFNELRGGTNSEDYVVASTISKVLYKGTPCQYDAGGYPLSVVDLTYEEFLKRYKKWYTPSNCKLYLYGDLDAQEYLNKLESRYLKGCTRTEVFIPRSENYLQSTMQPTRILKTCPAGDVRSVLLSWLTVPSDDDLQALTLSVLTEILLGDTGAPLYTAIVNSDLGQDLHSCCGTDIDAPVLSFTIGFSHAQEGKEDEIEAFLIEQIRTLVENGIPKDLIDAAIRRLEFRIKEIPDDSFPFGLSAGMRAARCWMRGKDPEASASSVTTIELLKEKIAQGRYFENWMEENLLKNKRRALITVVSDDSYDLKFQQELNAKYQRLMDSGYDSTADKALFKAFLETPDSDEALATIKKITLKDLTRPTNWINQKRVKISSGVKFYDCRVFTRGIVYLRMGFDIRNLELKEKFYVPLMLRCMQICGTKRHTSVEISVLINSLTGSFYMYPITGRTRDQAEVSTISVFAKMLRPNLEPAMDVISEILTMPDFQDMPRLKMSLTDMLTDYESSYDSGRSAYALSDAVKFFSTTTYESEIYRGTEQWLFLLELKKSLDSGALSWNGLAEILTNLWRKVFCQRAMLVHITHDEDDSDLSEFVVAFANKFPMGKFVRHSNYYETVPKGLAWKQAIGCDGPNGVSEERIGTPQCPRTLVLSAGLAANVMAIRFNLDSEKRFVAATLLAGVLNSGYLWQSVRLANGAYGVDCHVSYMDRLFVFSSMRDSRVIGTYADFLKSLEQDIDPEELSDLIVSLLGSELKTQSPQTIGSKGFNRIIYKGSSRIYSIRRKLMLGMTVSDLKLVASDILECSKSSISATTICGTDIVKKQNLTDVHVLPL